jgi:hypothetical protein
MMRRATGLAAGLATALVAMAAGCSPAPLAREQQVDALLKENRRIEDLLIASEQRVAELSPPGVTPGQVAPPKPKVTDPFVAIDLRFSKYTQVVGPADKPAEQRLKVVLEPRDGEGDVVKRLGSLSLEVFETGGPAPKLYGVWKFSAEEMAQTWLSGLGTYSYVLKLPWPQGRPPQAKELLLKATFLTLSGEALTAEAKVPMPGTEAAAKPAEEKAALPPAKKAEAPAAKP